MLFKGSVLNRRLFYCVLSSSFSDNKPEDCKSTATESNYGSCYDCYDSTGSETAFVISTRIFRSIVRIVGSVVRIVGGVVRIVGVVGIVCRHCVVASVALVIAVVVNVSSYLALFLALALFPVVISIGYPSGSEAVVVRRRRCSHCVSASIARAVAIAVVVSCLFKLLTFATRAFVPMVSIVLLPFGFGSVSGMSESRIDNPSANATYFGIGFGSRACRFVILLGIGYGASVSCTYVPMSACILLPFTREVVSYSSRCAAYVTIGIAIVIVFVSRFVKLLTVTACAFVPVMSFVLLPLCFCTVICQFAIGLTANRTYRLRGAGCGTAGVLMIYSYTTFVTVSVNGIGIIATFISYLSASIIAQVIVIVTVRVFTNVGHATVSVANVIGILVQMSESHARGFWTVTAS